MGLDDVLVPIRKRIRSRRRIWICSRVNHGALRNWTSRTSCSEHPEGRLEDPVQPLPEPVEAARFPELFPEVLGPEKDPEKAPWSCHRSFDPKDLHRKAWGRQASSR